MTVHRSSSTKCFWTMDYLCGEEIWPWQQGIWIHNGCQLCFTICNTFFGHFMIFLGGPFIQEGGPQTPEMGGFRSPALSWSIRVPADGSDEPHCVKALTQNTTCASTLSFHWVALNYYEFCSPRTVPTHSAGFQRYMKLLEVPSMGKSFRQHFVTLDEVAGVNSSFDICLCSSLRRRGL